MMSLAPGCTELGVAEYCCAVARHKAFLFLVAFVLASGYFTVSTYTAVHTTAPQTTSKVFLFTVSTYTVVHTTAPQTTSKAFLFELFHSWTDALIQAPNGESKTL